MGKTFFKGKLKRSRNALRKSSMPSKTTLKKVVKEVVQKSAEQKLSYNWNTATMALAGAVVNLQSVIQGDTFGTRNGNLVKNRYVDVNFQILHSVVDSSSDGIAVSLVYDRQPNGTVPAYSDIFDLTNTSNAANAFKNYQVNADRFHIAWQELLPNALSGTIPTGGVATAYSKMRKFYKIPDKLSECRFAGAATTVPITGAWYLTYVTGSVATAASTIDYTSKVAFTDI